jgi:hypothetical protein
LALGLRSSVPRHPASTGATNHQARSARPEAAGLLVFTNSGCDLSLILAGGDRSSLISRASSLKPQRPHKVATSNRAETGSPAFSCPVVSERMPGSPISTPERIVDAEAGVVKLSRERATSDHPRSRGCSHELLVGAPCMLYLVSVQKRESCAQVVETGGLLELVMAPSSSRAPTRLPGGLGRSDSKFAQWQKSLEKSPARRNTPCFRSQAFLVLLIAPQELFCFLLPTRPFPFCFPSLSNLT